jgi:enterochelin esterase family protein
MLHSRRSRLGLKTALALLGLSTLVSLACSDSKASSTTTQDDGGAGKSPADGGADDQPSGGSPVGGAAAGGRSGAANMPGGQTAGSGGAGSRAGSPPVGQIKDGDVTIMSPFVDAPEMTARQDIPHGKTEGFNLPSDGSAVFPTDIASGATFTRTGSVYIPAGYTAGTEAPFMVIQDGLSFYINAMVPALDNLIAARRIPPLVAIFVEPGPNEDTPKGERSFEYDSVSDAYVTFVETELLPKIKADHGLSLTQDPEGRAAMGGSSGGAAAFTMAWFRPDLYHRVFAYSGSFCDLQPNADYPRGAWEYHEHLIAETPLKPLRIALEVGTEDLNWNNDKDMLRNWLPANQAMAKALADKGYTYTFVLAKGAGHIDLGVLYQTLPDMLTWLWQDYPIP